MVDSILHYKKENSVYLKVSLLYNIFNLAMKMRSFLLKNHANMYLEIMKHIYNMFIPLLIDVLHINILS